MVFALAGAPLLVALTAPPAGHEALFYAGAAIAAAGAATITLAGRRSPTLFYLAAYGGLPGLTLMQAHTGGIASAYTLLLMMTMVFFGTQCDGRELLVALGLLVVLAFGPMLVIGPPAYPVSYTHATMAVLIGTVVAGALRFLILETEALTRRLADEAGRDALTGLLNRRGWDAVAEGVLADAKRAGLVAAVAVLDIDRFKDTNDTLGHDVGDDLLRETAERLRTHLREGDLIARFGGDEFIVLLKAADADSCTSVLERLRSTTPPRGQFSAGLALHQNGESLSELIRRADVAMYAAKATGPGRIRLEAGAPLDALDPTE